MIILIIVDLNDKKRERNIKAHETMKTTEKVQRKTKENIEYDLNWNENKTNTQRILLI